METENQINQTNEPTEQNNVSFEPTEQTNEQNNVSFEPTNNQGFDEKQFIETFGNDNKEYMEVAKNNNLSTQGVKQLVDIFENKVKTEQTNIQNQNNNQIIQTLQSINSDHRKATQILQSTITKAGLTQEQREELTNNPLAVSLLVQLHNVANESEPIEFQGSPTNNQQSDHNSNMLNDLTKTICSNK